MIRYSKFNRWLVLIDRYPPDRDFKDADGFTYSLSIDG